MSLFYCHKYVGCIWLDTLPSVSCEAQLDVSSAHLDDKKEEEEDKKVTFAGPF